MRRWPGIVYYDDLMEIAGNIETANRIARLILAQGIAKEYEYDRQPSLTSIPREIERFNSDTFYIMFKEQEKAREEERLNSEKFNLEYKELKRRKYMDWINLLSRFLP